jgi:uncharacterized protein YcbX
MGDIAAQWFSDFLGRKLRLVRFDPDFQAPVQHAVDRRRRGAQPVLRWLSGAGDLRGVIAGIQ